MAISLPNASMYISSKEIYIQIQPTNSLSFAKAMRTSGEAILSMAKIYVNPNYILKIHELYTIQHPFASNLAPPRHICRHLYPPYKYTSWPCHGMDFGLNLAVATTKQTAEMDPAELEKMTQKSAIFSQPSPSNSGWRH